jgi:hypothetical protein
MEFGNKLKKLRAKIKINQPARQVLAGDYFFLLFFAIFGLTFFYIAGKILGGRLSDF